MKILYIVNGLGFSKNMPIGGADKRVSQIGKILKDNGNEIFVLTTSEGERVLREDGLNAVYYKTEPPPYWRASWFRSILGRILSYLYLTFKNPEVVDNRIKFDIIYPSSDYFFDLIPAILLGKSNSAKLVGIVHHRIDLPWRRRGNLISNLLLFISQRLDFFLFKFFDLVFVPDNKEGILIKEILSKYTRNKVVVAFFRNGVEFKKLDGLAEVEKRFDACFLGGFRESKGAFDIVPVWREVAKSLPEAKILVIGGGAELNERKVREMVEEVRLSKNVIFTGVLPRESLFSFVKACRIFVSPSYEEGWGIALLEAMACGLPAVVYDLSAYSMIGSGLFKVTPGDTSLMAHTILSLLRNPELYQEKRLAAIEVSSAFDWSVASERELSKLLILKNG